MDHVASSQVKRKIGSRPVKAGIHWRLGSSILREHRGVFSLFSKILQYLRWNTSMWFRDTPKTNRREYQQVSQVFTIAQMRILILPLRGCSKLCSDSLCTIFFTCGSVKSSLDMRPSIDAPRSRPYWHSLGMSRYLFPRLYYPLLLEFSFPRWYIPLVVQDFLGADISGIFSAFVV